MTVAEALRDATARIGVEWGRIDAETLMAHALGMSRSAMLLSAMRQPAPPAFADLLARRLADEPVAYILGSAEFYGREFAVGPAVLIPRSDSESVVAAALEAAPDATRILDCGTGSGALLLTLLAELPRAEGVGIDRSAAALALATSNAAALEVAERVRLIEADWCVSGWSDGLGRFDLVIANPPYVEDAAPLDRSVRDHEPHGALFAGPDGLADYRRLIPQLARLLNRDGVAVLEIGASQSVAVSEIAAENGFDAALRRDLADRPRALILRRTP